MELSKNRSLFLKYLDVGNKPRFQIGRYFFAVKIVGYHSKTRVLVLVNPDKFLYDVASNGFGVFFAERLIGEKRESFALIDFVVKRPEHRL